MEATLACPWERRRSVIGTKGRRFCFPLRPRGNFGATSAPRGAEDTESNVRMCHVCVNKFSRAA